jgi:2-iminobutanoate/2-iminopropanoate deaminase
MGYVRQMVREIIHTAAAPSSPLYTQGVRIGSAIHVSGMVGLDVASGQLVGSTIQEQTRQALLNCLAVVEAASGRPEDVAQVTVLLARPEDFDGMNEAYAAVFATEPPTRAVARLGPELSGVLVSIMMTAYVGG